MLVHDLRVQQAQQIDLVHPRISKLDAVNRLREYVAPVIVRNLVQRGDQAGGAFLNQYFCAEIAQDRLANCRKVDHPALPMDFVGPDALTAEEHRQVAGIVHDRRLADLLTPVDRADIELFQRREWRLIGGDAGIVAVDAPDDVAERSMLQKIKELRLCLRTASLRTGRASSRTVARTQEAGGLRCVRFGR